MTKGVILRHINGIAFTGLPTQDETVKTTLNPINLLLSVQFFNGLLRNLEKKGTSLKLEGIMNQRKRRVKTPYSRL